MADGFLLDVDTSKLREADNQFKKLIANAEKLQTVLKSALGSSNVGTALDILERVNSSVSKINSTKLSPDVDTKDLERFSDNISEVVDMIQFMSTIKFGDLFDDKTLKKLSLVSHGESLSFFDSKTIENLEGNAFLIEDSLERVKKAMKGLQKEWKQNEARSTQAIFVPPTKDDGTPWRKNSNAYKYAKEKFEAEKELEEQKLQQEKESERIRIELRRKALNELQARLEQELKIAKMTEDEKLQMEISNAKKKLAEDDKVIKEKKRRYKELFSELFDISKKIENAEKQGDAGKAAIKIYEEQFSKRNEERLKIEEDYGDSVVGIAEKAQRRILDAELKRIKERQNQERSTYSGALAFAKEASTINEMKEAQKYLQIARGNVDVNDKTAIDQLNEEYTRLRATIENLTTAEKNETSLQPTLRNEYARLLVELDKINAAQERMAKSSVYKSAKGKTDVTQMTEKELEVLKDEEALQKRLVDVQAKMNSIEKAALPDLRRRIELEKELANWTQIRVELGRQVGGKAISEARRGGGTQGAKDYLFAEEQVNKIKSQLDAIEQQESAIDDVKRKHDADRARESIALTEKTEAKKAEIAKRKAREAYEEYKKTGVLSVDKAERLIGLTDNAKNAAQAEKAIKSLENAKKRLDNTDSRYRTTVQKINQAISKHKKTLEQTKPVVEATVRLSAEDALNNAKNARTMKDLRQALKDLKQAREELDIKNDANKIKDVGNAINDVNNKIKELEGKQKEVKKNNNDLSASFAGLKRFAIAWIGIEALENYARKVVETRREFELLQKSLQTLLQDKNEANKIWQQTLDLALVSPFSVKELVGYTRQLAAYRIETELLHDRTKRLADVSAGLGVDMSRLILAYGQVRAASFLRATELRQFTEAGIPMLDELSNKLSEVEGRFVSVGDVMEMISKRKISFEDVDETFISMTSQGGMFYKMQEKQADTIHGMISNLEDAFDLMFNEIGKSNDSWIKRILKGITTVVKEWRRFSAEFTGLATGVVVGKLASSFVSIGKSIWDWYKGAKSVGMALKTISPTGWGAIIGALASIAVYFWQINQEADELKQKIGEINAEQSKDLKESIDKYKELASVIRSATSSYNEINNALKELSRLYGDILPDEMLTIENIQKMSEGYKEATGALKEYYNAKTREQKQEIIESKFKEKYQSAVSSAYKSLQGYIDIPFSVGETFNELFGADENTVRGIIAKTIEDAKEGTVAIEKFYSTVIQRVEVFYDKVGRLEELQKKGAAFASLSSEPIKLLTERATAMVNVTGLPFETQQQQEAYNKQQELNKLYQEQLINVGKLKTKIESVYEGGINDTLKTEILKLYKTLKLTAPVDLFTAIKTSALDVGSVIADVNVAVRELFLKNNKKTYGETIIQQFFEDIDKDIQKIKGGTLRNSIESLMREVADETGLRIFDNLLIDDKQSLSDYRKIVSEEYGRMKAAVDAYKTSFEEAGESIVQRELVNNIHNKDLMDQYEKALPILLKYKTLLGDDENKTTPSDGGKDKDWWLEMVSGLKNLHSEFLTLRDDLDATEARALALKKFKGVFDEILPHLGDSGKKIDLGSLNFETEQGMIDAFTYLKSLGGISKEARLAIEKALTDIHGEIRIKTKIEDDQDLKSLVEDMFSDYELSLDLEELDFPPDLAKQLFNLDTMDLESLRKRLEALRTLFVGKKMEKEYEEYLKKVSEMEDKAQLERLKKYSKYLVKGMNERVKLKYEEARQLAEIESLNYTPEQEKIIKDSVREETQKKMDKLDWEDFKNSEVYIRIFQDLERVSTKTLKTMRDKLLQMKGQLKNLDPTEVKVIVESLEKLDSAISKRNPYKTAFLGIGKYFEALKNVKKLEKDLLEGKEKEDRIQDDLTAFSSMLGDEEQKLKTLEKSTNTSETDLKLQREIVEWYRLQVTELEKQLKIQQKLNGKTSEGLSDAEKYRATFTGDWSDIGSDISNAASALPQMAAEVEKLFGAMDARTKDTIESISEIGSGVGSAIQGFASQNYIQAASGILQAIGGAFAIGDKKKERAIQREIEKVKDLQRAYEKLEEAISYSYNIDDINRNYESARKNIEDQIEATEKMRSLEESKKKTDKAKIKEYTQQIEDYQKQLQELEDERINQLGGIAGGDAIKSASESFVNAWVDAFKETGDGLSGLEEQFNEVFMNLVKKQLLGRGVDKMLKGLYADLDAMLDDGAMSSEEYEDLNKQWNTLSPQIDNFLTDMVNSLGIADDITKKTGGLSGLQEGIQGITEDQADILAAYWSSVRFIVSNIEQKFTEYARQMLGTDLSANPILNELKAQTSLLDEINDKLGSIIGHSGGAHVKTHLIS